MSHNHPTDGHRRHQGHPGHPGHQSQSTETTPVLLMHAAAIGYGKAATVRDVDLRIDPGEVVALIGPNGSGKTTLVRGVLGLAPLMGGSIELFGMPAAQFRQRYRIGYVPQRHTVGGGVPSTVEEVVASGRLPRKHLLSRSTRQDRQVVADAIETVGLADQHRAAVATLSGGQQRRVLIARALASQPDVLVMDEPTAGVDAESQEGLVRTLGHLAGQGLTLLVVTHEITPLTAILTRAIALHDGRVVADVALTPHPTDVLDGAHPDAAPHDAGPHDGGPAAARQGVVDLLAGHQHDDSHDAAPASPLDRWRAGPGLRGGGRADPAAHERGPGS